MIKSGLRIFYGSWKKRFFGFKRYDNVKSIAKNCWNGKYFETSTGHFKELYIRDFCWSVPGLKKLGFEKELVKSIGFILESYKRDCIKTSITYKGKCVDIFMYSPDSLAYLLRSIRLIGFDISDYKDFLEMELKKYFEKCIDPGTGLVNNGNYGSMKDQYVRESSVYDNCMSFIIQQECKKLKLKNPFKKYNYKKIILDNFWNGGYFFEDLKKKKVVCGDANVLPYWCGLIDSKKMFNNSVKAIKKEGLDDPLPLKYSSVKMKGQNLIGRVFTPNYESNVVWTHLGLLYLTVVKKFDKGLFLEYFDKYKKLFKGHGTMPEVLDSGLKPYRNLFYYCDGGMLWSAIMEELS